MSMKPRPKAGSTVRLASASSWKSSMAPKDDDVSYLPSDSEETDSDDDSYSSTPMSSAVVPPAPTIDGVQTSANDQFKVQRTQDDHAKDLDKDRSNRLEFLLRQTEIFSHFMKPALSGVGESKDAGKIDLKTGTPTRGRPLGGSKKSKELKSLIAHARKDDNSQVALLAKRKDIPQFETSPSYIENTELRDYQIRGLNWLISLYENGINGILADEMGLGKTIQTIALLGYLQNYRQERGPHLIVAPLSTVTNWKNEFERWCPSLKTVTFVVAKSERPGFIKNVLNASKWNVCITTYEYVLNEFITLRKFHWVYLIVDEGHRLKNEKTKFSETIRKYKSKNRLLLTGTPLQNNLHELWALLNMLLPDVFNSAEDFDSWFDTNACLGNISMVDRLHGILRPFLLRRIKADVEKSLLPKKEIKVYVGLSEMQREWYRKVLLDDVTIFRGGVAVKMKIAHALMHLRKVCNHPYLFPTAEPGPPYTTESHIVNNSGKMVVLDKLLPKLHAEGSRVLIFSQFPTMMNILEDYLIWKGWKYSRLDGNTDVEERQEDIDDYNRKDSDKFIFLLSTRAGGLGINLATADVVIIYDSDWNPQMDLQATDRCHRIGQTKQVRVFRLITENTIDEKIVERAEVKLHLDRKVIQQGRLIDAGNNAPTKQDMLKIIAFGAESIIASKESTVTDESIEEILARSKVRADDLNSKLGTLDEGSLRNFTSEEPLPLADAKVIDLTAIKKSRIHDFEGLDYRVLRERKRNQKLEEDFITTTTTSRRNGRSSYNDSESNAELDEKKDPSYAPPPPSPPPLPYAYVYKKPVPIKIESVTTLAKPSPKKRGKKPIPVFDFQFGSARLMELYFRQLDLHKSTKGRVDIPRSLDFEPEEFAELEKKEMHRLRRCVPLTPAEHLEYDTLASKNPFIMTMSKPVFLKYWSAVVTIGLENLGMLLELPQLKCIPAETLVDYHQTFVRKCFQVCDVERLLIKQGFVNLLPPLKLRKELLARKIKSCADPHTDLKIVYDPPELLGTRFRIHHDRLVMCTLYEIYKQGDKGEPMLKLQKALRANSDVGWFLRTRSREELHARTNLLFEMMEKEEVVGEGGMERPTVQVQGARAGSSKTLEPGSSTKPVTVYNDVQAAPAPAPTTPKPQRLHKVVQVAPETPQAQGLPKTESPTSSSLSSSFVTIGNSSPVIALERCDSSAKSKSPGCGFVTTPRRPSGSRSRWASDDEDEPLADLRSTGGRKRKRSDLDQTPSSSGGHGKMAKLSFCQN